MRKVFFLGIMCMMALSIGVMFSCTEKDNGTGDDVETTSPYVDLGLPSGTKWKDSNEFTGSVSHYTYDEAIQNFGDKIPTKEQFQELMASCDWIWTDKGYRVVGPNGKSITLPFGGIRYFNGSINLVGSQGSYWSSMPDGFDNAWVFCIGVGRVYMGISMRSYGYSVRLVQD